MSAIGSVDIYTDYFGLLERPFSLVPDPDFLFWSAEHRRAYTTLEYGLVTRAPITLITGEVGAGKTTLLMQLLRSLEDDVSVAMIANAHSGDRGELIRWVLQALSQPVGTEASYVDMFHQFQAYLVAEYAAGRRVILIFDEAQNISRESLEELRMFTNINTNKDELLQLILVGQPELRAMINRPDLTQFAQRIAASFHIPNMDADTVKSYISHRLRAAGATVMLFDGSACKMIHQVTGGVPRLVNQICDLSMVYTFADNRKRITANTVHQVLNDDVFFGGGKVNGKPLILQDPIHEI
jgi:general secretion pathway protein A